MPEGIRDGNGPGNSPVLPAVSRPAQGAQTRHVYRKISADGNRQSPAVSFARDRDCRTGGTWCGLNVQDRMESAGPRSSVREPWGLRLPMRSLRVIVTPYCGQRMQL